ncbi:peptidoglycan-recognition protein SD-like [Episyrphus balteatus]|uniref:peptidoglycan-recognition protein SD-like n=1 Tax=Episyrphus balteatus TaxID=286459 RepID=UPI0024865EB4|nr:peptidoglycan-recognition protein SD-like [Episyrphus balteatus]
MTKVILGFFLCLAWTLSAACGLTIVSRADWHGQEPDGEIDNLKSPVNKVIISHTASGSCNNRASCDHKVKSIQKQQMDVMGFSDIAYNFLIGNDGNVYEGRGWNKVGAHTRGHNTDSIGISFIGIFDSEAPSEDALNIAKELIAEGVRNGKLSANYKLFGHRQFSSTNSPGDSLYAIIKKWPQWSRGNR